jgi:hypothetical protein
LSVTFNLMTPFTSYILSIIDKIQSLKLYFLFIPRSKFYPRFFLIWKMCWPKMVSSVLYTRYFQIRLQKSGIVFWLSDIDIPVPYLFERYIHALEFSPNQETATHYSSFSKTHIYQDEVIHSFPSVFLPVMSFNLHQHSFKLPYIFIDYYIQLQRSNV